MNSKTSVLKKLIEQLVIKEVKKQVPILLQELLHDDASTHEDVVEERILTPLDAKRKSFKEMLGNTVPPQINQVPKEIKKYSKDPMINQILNETVNDLGARESGRAPAVGLDGGFQSQEIGDDGVVLNESISSPALRQSIPQVADSVLDFKGKDPAVDNLMKWDFKAILEKSKSKRR